MSDRAEREPGRIQSAVATTWKSWRSGPDDLILECIGSRVSRFVYGLYRRWPLPRGRRLAVRLLGRLPGLASHVRVARFRSHFGGEFLLDMTRPEFHYLSGLYPPEPLEISIMVRLVRPGDVFVDVGANVGLYLAHVVGRLKVEGEYIALEPDPDNFGFLSKTFGGNPRIRLVNAAASDHDGDATLLRINTLEAKLATGGSAQDGVSVRTCRLDKLLSTIDHQVSLVVKVDVEGHESSVIRGMSGIRARGIIPIMMIEYLPDENGKSRSAINRALVDTFGGEFAYYSIAAEYGGLRSIHLGDEVSSSVLNILAVPRLMAHRLTDLFWL